MITFNRKTTLNWVLNPSAFEAINQTTLVVLTRPLTTAINPVNKMLACAEEMEMILPEILGVSPKSSATDWQRKLSDYWHNFRLDVSVTGYEFDTSLVFDIADYRRKDYINDLIATLNLTPKANKDGETSSKVNVEKKLFEYITSDKVSETERYKYMSPVNIEQYLAWRYCLVSSKVANEAIDLTRSTNIDFFLMDEAKAKAKKDAVNALRSNAIKKYYELISSKDAESAVENMLVADNMVHSIKELNALSDTDREPMLLDMVTQNPQKFVELLEDKNIGDKAEIKKLCMASLIRQLPNTSIYADVSDPSIVLGNTLEQVVSYMNADVNAAYVNELRLRFKNLNN